MQKRALWSWAFYDWANSAFSAIVSTFIFAAYFTRSVAESQEQGTTQWGLAIGVAGIVIALVSPIFGAMADRGGRRKGWIGFCTLLCVIPTALMWFVEPSNDYLWLALLLAGISTVGGEAAFVFYNAMLPDLAPREQIGRWSGIGWGFGYAGGVLSLFIALFLFIEPKTAIFTFNRDTAEHVRATFLLCALWYLVFSLPLLFFTPADKPPKIGMARAAREGFNQLRQTLGHIRSYAGLARFLVARMLYIDGLVTLFTFGGVYASGAFGMEAEQVLVFGIALNVTAGIGAALFAFLDDRIGAKKLILFSLGALMLFGSGALLTSDVNVFWALGLAVGIFVGPVQASSRSYVARVAPAEIRNEIFGFFVFSGKATSFIGPLTVAALTALSGSQRIGMAAWLLFIGFGALLMFTVPDDRLGVMNNGHARAGETLP